MEQVAATILAGLLAGRGITEPDDDDAIVARYKSLLAALEANKW